MDFLFQPKHTKKIAVAFRNYLPNNRKPDNVDYIAHKFPAAVLYLDTIRCKFVSIFGCCLLGLLSGRETQTLFNDVEIC